MNLKRIFVPFLIIACFIFSGYLFFQQSHAQTAVTTISGKFYRLEILATNGQAGITAINSASINDFGTVAFNTNGAGLFTANRSVKSLQQQKDLNDPKLDTLTVTNQNVGNFKKGFVGDNKLT